jgi:hypothetical protein
MAIPTPARAAGRTRLAVALSAVVVAGGAVSAAVGLLVAGFYPDPPVVGATSRGNDLALLAVGLPLLAVASWSVYRGSVLGRPVWLGMLAYCVYAYSYAVFAGSFNDLFLLHVTLWELSIVALVLGLVETDTAAIGARFPARVPARWVAVLLLLIGGSMAVMWGFNSLRFAVTGQAPTDVLPLPLDRVHLAYALDLGLLTPPLILAGVLVWNRRPWGCVLSVVMLIAVAVFQLNYVAMRILVADVADIGPVDPFEYAFVAVLAAVVGWLLLAMRTGRTGADGPAGTAEGL